MLGFAVAGALMLGVAMTTPATSSQDREILAKRSKGFWYPNMGHDGPYRGFAPDSDGDKAYQIHKSVSPGDGDGIQRAINDDNGRRRHGRWFASQPRVVFIPPGTYDIRNTILMNTATILMGDPSNPPVLKAAAGFAGKQTLLSGQDPTTGVKGEESFAIGLKHLVLDTTNIPGDEAFTALYWGVAQGSHLQNVNIILATPKDGKGHSGIHLGRGSTLGVSDVRIEGGQNGVWHDSHQQAAYKNVHFVRNQVGMLISGGNAITIMGSVFEKCRAGVVNTGGSPWIALVDSRSVGSGVSLATTGRPSFLIENLDSDSDSDVAQVSGQTVLGPQRHVATFSHANTLGRDPVYGPTTSVNKRPDGLAPGGRWPVLAAPSHADKTAGDFINVKDPAQNGGHTVLGDGSRDESDALNQVLLRAARDNRIAYFPFGHYRVDSTLVVPPGSRIVGEAWATISGSGDFFKDEHHPKPIVSVGREGDVGVAQMQDMRFTVSDVLAGAIVVQFNMAGKAPGDVALWNSLITVGGTRGASNLTDACRDAAKACKGAFLGMHMARTSSAYVDNVWNWVADHVAEDFDGGSSIAAKGGVLVESTKATWLHALGSEHWWLYQLNLRRADNVMVSLLQAETNYEQGANASLVAPAPWRPDAQRWGDPDFAWCAPSDKACRMGLSNLIAGGSNIYTYASAAWAFFSGPGYQGCGQFRCQATMHRISETPRNLQAFGMCSKDAEAVLMMANGTRVMAQGGFEGSWPGGGGVVGRYTP